MFDPYERAPAAAPSPLTRNTEGSPLATIQADAQLETMVSIAKAAGELVMAGYAKHRRGALEIGDKGSEGPVTAADRETNRFICEALSKHFPRAGVVAEESVPAAAELPALLLHDEVFFVDPIDGTREFIDQTGEFAVMIGLARNGAAAAGVVLLPVEGTLLAGRVGQRAFAEQADGQRRMLSVNSTQQF
ncbi:MAG TPA: hypothetical protein ENK23_04305, partial [Sorangium sp.]|nr:hypothetical protein [Sorangium sp.]